MKAARILFAPLLVCLLALTGCAGSNPRPTVDTQRAADANSALGMDFLQRGDYERALEALTKARGFDRDHLQANWGLGMTYAALNEPDKAREHFETAVSVSQTPNLLNAYGAFLCEQNEVEKAVARFRQAADHPRYTQPALPYTNAGFCLFQAGRPGDAEAYYQKALEVQPGYIPALGRLAELRYQQGRLLDSRALLLRADVRGDLPSPMLLQAARTELALKDHNTALKYLRRYNLANPGEELTLGQLAGQQ